MTDSTRRDFLKQTSAILAGTAALSSAGAVARAEEAQPAAQSVPASSSGGKVRLGFVGPNGRGASLLQMFMGFEDTEIVHLCDIDEHRLAQAVGWVEEANRPAAKTSTDMRRLFEDKDVDAVVIATPDHWHAPATILACDAGKHVYVEKPASHNIREGRLMIEAARRNKRVVQVGTQSRSQPVIRKAMELLRDGAIGEVLVSKAWNSQLRGNIGKHQPTDPPKGLDYDAWVGPAAFLPYQANRLHGVWRWWYNFGTGDIGNDGVHDIDIARWGLGVNQHPSRIAGQGGKYFFDDDQEFPDTYYVSYEYDLPDGRPRQLIYEQRTWSPYVQEGHENGNAFYGTKGMMILGKKTGYQLFGERNNLKDKGEGNFNDAHHGRDFLDAIKQGKTPNCDIEEGHLSSSLSHLGNIALRIGRTLNFDPKAETFAGDDEANALITRKYREGGHWAIPKGV